jgi:hypothetical protein
VETFEEFYGLLQSEAVMLQKKYQPQLRKGIKIAVDLVNSVKQDEKDGDVDVRVKIAPNTITEDITITPGNFDDRDEIIEELKKLYHSVLSIKNTEGIPKYQDLISELDLVKQAKNAKDANDLLDKIKKQVEIARKIQEYRKKYSDLEHPIAKDAVVIYGEYDLTISPKSGDASQKKLKGEYNSVSSQATGELETAYNAQELDEIMMPIQNQFLRYFTIDQNMIHQAKKAKLNNDEHFPNPTHDAEVKLFEYLARQIVRLVNGAQSDKDQSDESQVVKETNQIALNEKKYVKALQLKKEINKYTSNIRDLKQSTEQVKGKKVEIQKIITRAKQQYPDDFAGLNSFDQEHDCLQKLLRNAKKKPFNVSKKERSSCFTNFSVINEYKTEIDNLELELEEKQKELAPYQNGEINLADNWYDDNDQINKAQSISKSNNEELTQLLEKWNVTGLIKINDEQDACRSCQSMITQFIDRFGGSENITVNVQAVVHHYYGKRGNR